MNSLKRLLADFGGEPDLYEMMLAVLDELPNHHQFIDRVFDRITNEKLHIILMVHRSEDAHSAIDREIEQSHSRVRAILNMNKPAVVGFEGSSDKVFTFKKWAEETAWEASMVRGMDLSFSQKIMMRRMRDDIKGNAIAAYMRKNPKVQVTGMEDRKLKIIQHFTLLLYMKCPEKDPRFGEFKEAATDVRKLRSELAAAKVLTRMYELQAKTGAVVIGLRHGEDLEEVHKDREIGERWKFYNTVPEHLQDIER